MAKRFFLTLIIIAAFASFFLVSNRTPQEQNRRTEVVFWTLQLGTFDNYINSVIEEFEAQNPDIKIRWVDVPYSEGEKRVLASLLSNCAPDLINITADFSSALTQKEALEKISLDEAKDFNPRIMSVLKYEDGYSSFPFYATSSVTIYNERLFKKTRIRIPPKTYDELNKVSSFIKAKANAYAQMPTLCENDTFLKILNKYEINSPEKIKSPKAAAIFDEYKNLYQKNYIPSESITQTHREVLEKYGAQQIVFLQAGANFLNLIKENSPGVYKDTNVTNQLTGSTNSYDFSLMNLAIPKNAKNKEAAKKFALFLLNKKNQLDFAKLAAILPVNEAALEDDYFKTYSKNDIMAKARYLSASQMKNLQTPVYYRRNKHEVINLINLTTQEIMLDKESTTQALEKASQKWSELCAEP